jgi:uncharacterized protein YbbC (DUF1343 family)
MDLFSKALEDAVKASHAPGGVACVGERDRILFCGACGLRQSIPQPQPAEPGTLYDLASLTKVVATTTAILMLRDDGALDLDQPVTEILPVPAFRRFTIRHCLTHTTGLAPGIPWFREVNSINEVLQRVSLGDISSPPGARRVYSDLGFIILGKIVELTAGDSLDAFCRRRIFTPLGMSQTRFRPPAEWAANCAATENCPWRGCVMCGTVHDETCWAMGGVAGHAGLFSRAEDLALFCRALYERRLLPEKTVAEMSTLGQVPVYPWQGLGWKIDPWSSGSEGFLPSRTAIGHTGWTGTSIWLDLQTGLFSILLGNTCHPSRDNRNNLVFRREFHAPLARFFFHTSTNTHTGLDRLTWSEFDEVKGKRLAVLTNSAAVDQLGRPLLDVLRLSTDTQVKYIYTPEHGLQITAEAGERIASQGGPLPIVSLYGDQLRPDLAQLRDIDLFVIDLPDVGSRYYTYMATMLRCLQACAAARKPVLVLDRPNPLGGVVIEGPVAREFGKDVCCAPIPARHGMTLGELALFFRDRMLRAQKPHVMVSELDAWPRERLFAECSLPWVAPSPNMPTPETALAYAGTCLFEGVNMNEGRGTDTPFLLIGAPWLDAESVAGAILEDERPGCRLETLLYTPVPILGKAANPTFKNESCSGIRIVIEDPSSVRSFTLAVALLAAIRRRHPNDLKFNPHFDVLAGTSNLRERIERAESALNIVGAYARELNEFDAARPRLYE